MGDYRVLALHPLLVIVVKLAQLPEWDILCSCIIELMLVCSFSQYAQETQHEKILRGLSLGIALVSCFL